MNLILGNKTRLSSKQEQVQTFSSPVTVCRSQVTLWLYSSFYAVFNKKLLNYVKCVVVISEFNEFKFSHYFGEMSAVSV